MVGRTPASPTGLPCDPVKLQSTAHPETQARSSALAAECVQVSGSGLAPIWSQTLPRKREVQGLDLEVSQP